MRTSALKRASENTLIEKTFMVNKLNKDAWTALHEPLPLGFSSVVAFGDKTDMTRESAEGEEKLVK
jgi:hypothetical protein